MKCFRRAILIVSAAVLLFPLRGLAFSLGKPPNPVSISPSIAILGQNQEFSFTATVEDLDGAADILMTQVVIGDSTHGASILYVQPTNKLYLWDATVKRWSAPITPGGSVDLETPFLKLIGKAASVSRQGPRLVLSLGVVLKPEAAGRDLVYLQAASRRGASSKAVLKAQWLVVVKPTSDEALGKLRTTYGALDCFEADTEMLTLLNGKPVAGTLYGKYHFVRPDKERVELFSDPTRSVATDETVTIGSDLYLMSKETGRKQKVNVLNDAGVPQSAFDAANFMYKMDQFVQSHDVRMRPNGAQVAFDAYPRTPNPVYTSLGVVLDYAKGVVSSLNVVKDGTVLQTISFLEYQLVNGAWVPGKMVKAATAEGATLSTTMWLKNIRANNGIRIDPPFTP